MLKFKVRNFGCISTAEVELSPLLILVGKNNTGKSYLATLIWALGELQSLSAFRGGPRKPAWFTAFLKPLDKLGTRQISISQEMADEVLEKIQRVLTKRVPEFLSGVFALDGFEKTKVEIIGTGFSPFNFRLEWAEQSKLKLEEPSIVKISYQKGDESEVVMALPSVVFDGTHPWFTDMIFYQMAGFILFGVSWRAYRRQIYIPAARTGIMLALPALVSQALSPDDEAERMRLPRPLMQFLRRMARPPSSRIGRSDSPILQRLKDRLIHGQITRSKDAVSEFRYAPNGASIALPLHATSSMITELAPFMVALEGHVADQHLIFEEPEAHLHLEAQREMARIIARLVSSGTRVTLTTHSDTFLQQINNLMAHRDDPQRTEKFAKLGYDPEDLIDPKIVKAYEFCADKNGTQVREVELSPDGFVIPTLNETLISLAHETYALRNSEDV